MVATLVEPYYDLVLLVVAYCKLALGTIACTLLTAFYKLVHFQLRHVLAFLESFLNLGVSEVLPVIVLHHTINIILF